jgi:hypothetical protein
MYRSGTLMRRWRRGERIVSGLHRTDGSNILPGMKRSAWLLLPFASLLLAGGVRAETETIDLRALAKKARPAVMLLVVSDAAGKEIATGTGFLVSSDGKLITNHHVIENAASAVAKAENGGVFPVEGVLAADPKNDLVLLKIKGKDLPFLPLGNSEKIEVGTRIAVIGSPLGLEGTLSEGIVSAMRELPGQEKWLQITAAISPGSSGSPVLIARGEVIGVAGALLQGGQALNFAVPVQYAQTLILQVSNSASPRALASIASDDSKGDASFYTSFEWKAMQAARADADAKSNAFEWDRPRLLNTARTLVDRFPDHPEAHCELGRVYDMLGFREDSLTCYQRAIKLKSDYANAWTGMGFLYLNTDKNGDAIAAFSQAAKLKPDDTSNWFGLGLAAARSGQRDKAREAIRVLKRMQMEGRAIGKTVEVLEESLR